MSSQACRKLDRLEDMFVFDPNTLKAPEGYLETAISYTEPLLRKKFLKVLLIM